MVNPLDLGFRMPQGGDYISEGDNAISHNAQITADELVKRDWTRPAIASNSPVDIDTVTIPGSYAVMAANSPNLPEPALGVLEVFALGAGAARTQRFTPYRNGARVYLRQRAGSGTWNAWFTLDSQATQLAAGTDLDTITAAGIYDAGATVLNRPQAVTGSLEVFNVSRARMQRYTTWTAAPRVFVRISQPDVTAWLPWTEIAAPAAGTPAPAGPARSSGFKYAPLALTQAAGGGTETISAASIRWPVTLGITARRARLHVRNWNYSSGTAYRGAVRFTGLWAGRGNGKDFTAAPAQVLPAFTTDEDGAEYVSPWFSYDFTEDTQHLLSVGFTTAAGQANSAQRGGCWRTEAPADAAALSPAAAQSDISPFDVWLEIEVPANTPILAGFGDSNTVGTGTALPVHDSWLAQYCRQLRALPLFVAIHGSAASTWADPAAPKWARYAGTAAADAAVYFLHQNDLQDGITLPELQQRFRNTLQTVRSRISPNVYGATITPANNRTEQVEAVRKAYNAWLRTRPEGLLDCLDFSAAVSDDDRTIRAEDNADGLHFKTSGHRKIAAELQRRPVTPRTLSAGEISRLLSS